MKSRFATAMLRASLLLFAGLGPIAAPAQDRKTQDYGAESFDAAFRAFEREVVVIGFAPSYSVLSDAEEVHIEMVMNNLKAGAPLDKLIIAAWPDEQPTGAKDSSRRIKLSAQKLAEERAQAIAQFIQASAGRGLRIEIRSMVRAPQWLKKNFPQLMGGSSLGRAENGENRLIKLLEERGGPGKALILVKHEASQATI